MMNLILYHMYMMYNLLKLQFEDVHTSYHIWRYKLTGGGKRQDMEGAGGRGQRGQEV